jgi:hypothetical protein
MTSTQAIPVQYITKAATVVKRLAYLIAAIGTIASYGTQVSLLLDFQVGSFSYVIPATIDLLAICAAIALQIPMIDATTRKIAAYILTTAVIVSVAANVTGGHNLVARLAHAWPVVAYLLAELIANRIRMFVAKIQAAQAAAAAPAPVVVAAPRADVTPAVAVTARRAPHTNVARGHAHCTHAATSTARAQCRRQAARV